MRGARRALAVAALLVLGACSSGHSGGGPSGEKATTTVVTAVVVDGGDLGEQDATSLSTKLKPILTAEPVRGPRTTARTCIVASRPAGGGGTLVYEARLRWQGAPAVALAYHLSTGTLVRRVVVMDRATCRLLVVQSF